MGCTRQWSQTGRGCSRGETQVDILPVVACWEAWPVDGREEGGACAPAPPFPPELIGFMRLAEGRRSGQARGVYVYTLVVGRGVQKAGEEMEGEAAGKRGEGYA